MIKYVIILLFISLFFLSLIFTGHGGLGPINQLVYELGSPGTSWQDRQKVEERLKQLPSDEVLSILLFAEGLFYFNSSIKYHKILFDTSIN